MHQKGGRNGIPIHIQNRTLNHQPHPQTPLGNMAANRTYRLFADRNSGLVEWMDRPDCDPVKLRNTYRFFPVINGLISRWNTVYRCHIRPYLDKTRRYTLLDVGSGGGDITRSIHKWATRDGFLLDVTGIDPDPRAHEYATGVEGTRCDSLQFFKTDTGRLCREGRTFDFVICNHVLHHLSDDDLPGFLEDLEALADRRVVCSDIERSAIGYGLFSVATWPLFPNSFIRADGLISIRKSYRAGELRAAVPSGWDVIRQFPFRLLLILDKEPAGRQTMSDAG
jgi:2-polyprenyl-3-methyl-5-hydroxy-6-metoxy-1,4-benzoquinol methylase